MSAATGAGEMTEDQGDGLILVAGHATIDHIVALDRPFAGTGTAHGRMHGARDWFQPGGASYYASAALIAAGECAGPLAHIGDDALAEHYLAACQRTGVNTAGIAQVAGSRTTQCLLLYQPDGDFGCVLDADADASNTGPTQSQLDLIKRCRHLAVSAGNPNQTSALLDAVPDQTGFSWLAKLDDWAFPSALAARLAARSKYIFCNHAERAMVDAALSGPGRDGVVIFETKGGDGVLIDDGENVVNIPALEKIDCANPTGAGDTFAGATIAALIARSLPFHAAVQMGQASARALLIGRLREYPATPLAWSRLAGPR